MDNNDISIKLVEGFHKFGRTVKKKLFQSNINPAQVAVLKVGIDAKNKGKSNISLSEISNILNVAQPTITPIIKMLEEKDMIIKVHDEQDKRITLVCVTDKGIQMYKSHQMIMKKEFSEMFGKMGEEKCKQLLELVDEMNNYFTSK